MMRLMVRKSARQRKDGDTAEEFLAAIKHVRPGCFYERFKDFHCALLSILVKGIAQ